MSASIIVHGDRLPPAFVPLAGRYSPFDFSSNNPPLSSLRFVAAMERESRSAIDRNRAHGRADVRADPRGRKRRENKAGQCVLGLDAHPPQAAH